MKEFSRIISGLILEGFIYSDLFKMFLWLLIVTFISYKDIIDNITLSTYEVCRPDINNTASNTDYTAPNTDNRWRSRDGQEQRLNKVQDYLGLFEMRRIFINSAWKWVSYFLMKIDKYRKPVIHPKLTEWKQLPRFCTPIHVHVTRMKPA